MSPERESDERVWEAGFEGHRRAQLLRLARLPLAEKLRWLEEAHRVVRAIQNARRSGSARRD